MNISRTLENQEKISRTVKHFCNSFSWEIQSVKVWWNLNLLERHIKEKIIQWWFTNFCFFFFKLNDVSKLSFNHHLFLILQKHKLILQMNSFCEDFLHLLVSIQQLTKNVIMFCLYYFSLHHWKSKITLVIKMHTLDAMIKFVVNMTFLLQATAVFTKTHDSMLRTRTLKKISATQDRIFCCAMRKHERKVIFKIKILEENLVLKLFCKWLNKAMIK